MVITLEDIKNNPDFRLLIQRAHEYLEKKGYTEHGFRHVTHVSNVTSYILRELDYPPRVVELGAIAAYLHDVGNMHNRKYHGPTGANIVYHELRRLGMPLDEICDVTTAIANHEEEIGLPVTPITAALIIADKSDAHRTRVNKVDASDIHDRVNHAIIDSAVIVDKIERSITLDIVFDTSICQVMDYFEIYLTRMQMSKEAAEVLDCYFKLRINDLELIGTVEHHERNALQKTALHSGLTG